MFEHHYFSQEYLPADRNTVTVYNSSPESIPACTAIRISGQRVSDSSGVQQVIFFADRATDNFRAWGIAAENIAPKTAGTMILNGIARAFIVGGSGNYAVPGPAGLMASYSGKHLILYRGNEFTPGWILLNYTAEVKEYTGAFKLRYISDRTFEIYHGRYPDVNNYELSKLCGKTDLPGAENVPRQFITLPEGQTSAEVRLHALCVEGKYSVLINTSKEVIPGMFDGWIAGYIYENGDVQQVIETDTSLNFGRNWYL